MSDDVIQPSKSPQPAQVTLVKKKDGSVQFCVHYHPPSSVVEKGEYPLPRIDNILERLSDAKHFSSMVEKMDRKKTVVITPDGLLEFKVTPFGLYCAAGRFERVMDKAMAGLNWHICLVYLDEVVVIASSFIIQLKRLRAVVKTV